MVNFPFLDGDVPRRASYGLNISQLIRFVIVCLQYDTVFPVLIAVFPVYLVGILSWFYQKFLLHVFAS